MLATDLRWRRVFVAACPACMQFTRWYSFLIGPDYRVCDGYAVPTQWARLVRERVSNVVTAVVVEPIPQEQDRPTPHLQYNPSPLGCNLPPESWMAPYFMRMYLSQHCEPQDYVDLA